VRPAHAARGRRVDPGPKLPAAYVDRQAPPPSLITCRLLLSRTRRLLSRERRPGNTARPSCHELLELDELRCGPLALGCYSYVKWSLNSGQRHRRSAKRWRFVASASRAMPATGQDRRSRPSGRGNGLATVTAPDESVRSAERRESGRSRPGRTHPFGATPVQVRVWVTRWRFESHTASSESGSQLLVGGTPPIGQWTESQPGEASTPIMCYACRSGWRASRMSISRST
jgi:hypothetical protein